MNKNHLISALGLSTLAFAGWVVLLFGEGIDLHKQLAERDAQLTEAKKLAQETLSTARKQNENSSLLIEESQKLFVDIWWQAYTQAVIDAHFKVPQIIVQKDGDKFGIWRKSAAFDDPDRIAAKNPLMPDELPALAPLPEKATASAKKR